MEHHEQQADQDSGAGSSDDHHADRRPGRGHRERQTHRVHAEDVLPLSYVRTLRSLIRARSCRRLLRETARVPGNGWLYGVQSPSRWTAVLLRSVGSRQTKAENSVRRLVRERRPALTPPETWPSPNYRLHELA